MARSHDRAPRRRDQHNPRLFKLKSAELFYEPLVLTLAR